MKMTFMVMELIIGLIKGFIQEIGRKIKCMEKVQLHGRMEGNIQG